MCETQIDFVIGLKMNAEQGSENAKKFSNSYFLEPYLDMFCSTALWRGLELKA